MFSEENAAGEIEGYLEKFAASVDAAQHLDYASNYMVYKYIAISALLFTQSTLLFLVREYKFVNFVFWGIFIPINLMMLVLSIEYFVERIFGVKNFYPGIFFLRTSYERRLVKNYSSSEVFKEMYGERLRLGSTRARLAISRWKTKNEL